MITSLVIYLSVWPFCDSVILCQAELCSA